MEYLEPLDLSVAKRPILLKDETTYNTTKGVGLYAGNERLKDMDAGMLYVTSNRILWVNEAGSHAIQLHLSAVKQVNSTNGILRSSPKIVLTLGMPLKPHAPNSARDISPVLQNDLGQIRSYQQPPNFEYIAIDWECEICDTLNDGKSVKCTLCGVPHTATHPQESQAPSVQTPLPSALSTEKQCLDWTCEVCHTLNSVDLTKCLLCGVKNTVISTLGSSGGTDPGRSVQSTQIQCTACTFLNHSDIKSCEMCDTPLPGKNAAPNSGVVETSSVASHSASGSQTHPEPVLKLSFRGGGMPEALKQIRLAIVTKAWEKIESPLLVSPTTLSLAAGGSFGGVSGIMRNVEQAKKQTYDTIGDAFSDLAKLMENAAHMVKLAESISIKLANSSSASNSPEMATFRHYLNEIGISNPVTRESAGDMFTQELSRQLVEFLDQMIKTGHSGMIPLTDLYCLFNRARGVALVSPEDLYRSVVEFERLGLSFRMRKFDSGLLVVHDDVVAAQILELIAKHHTGLTAIDLAKLRSISIALATEQLYMTERVGLTCRDDTLEGLLFYPNLFSS
ncbi:hypothetical protein BASA83_000840 [Batrachochytrium salamandrivorans]|nr:hypothetical protein BASA83_000840 [Batrachochytrium salamandrivorans]